MRHLKLFEEFVKEGIIKRIKQDTERAKSFIIKAERKMNSLKIQIDKIGINDENAEDYVEYCYDIIMYLIRARMYAKGYNANGKGAHEAEISYMRSLGFEESEVQLANQIRFFRNGLLYYGTSLDKEYAEKVIDFTRKIYLKLINH